MWLGSDAQALATILAVYAQRHGGPSQLAADRLVALLTASNGFNYRHAALRFIFSFSSSRGMIFMVLWTGSNVPIVVSPVPDEIPETTRQDPFGFFFLLFEQMINLSRQCMEG